MNEELKVIIKAETDKFKKSIEDTKKQIKSFKEQVAEAGKSVDDNLSKAGEKISSGLKIGVTAIAAAGAALVALGASSAEYRNEQAKLTTAFESAGQSADIAKSTYNDLFRVLGDSGTATEAAGHLAQLKVGQEELAEYTDICQGVYATFGDSLPIEGLTEAINHTANLGEVQGTLADALEWSGISTDAFNESLAACNTEAEREKLIRETLNGLYSEAADTFEKNNAAILAQNEAQSKLNDAMAALGEATAPIMTMLTALGAEVLAAITPYLQSFAENYLPTIQSILASMGEALGTTLSFLLEHSTVLGVIAAVIATVVTAIGLYNAVAAVKAAMDAASVTTIWGLVAAHTAQAAAALVALAPYLLIVAAIAAVIAIIVLCIKHWDDIKEAGKKAWEGIKKAWEKAGEWFSSIWEKIQKAFANVAEWFSQKFEIAWLGIKLVWDVAANYFQLVWNNIKAIFSVVKNVLTGNFRDAWEGIKQVFSNFKSYFSNLWDIIKNTFTELGAKIGDAVGGAVKAGINRVIDWVENTINNAIGLINGAISLINKLPGVSVGRLQKLSLPRLAEGGIVNSTTIAMIGEAGREMVLPLDNHTEWMDKLAERINGANSAPIILQVDGKTFGEISINTINQLTRQRGKLPLILA